MTKLRGGQRAKKAISSSQGRLLECLWTRPKGEQPVTLTAKKIGCSVALLLTWRNREAVPLHHTGGISRALKVPISSLNYEEVAWMMGTQPPWEKIVKSCKFSENEEAYILSGNHPRNFKQIEADLA